MKKIVKNEKNTWQLGLHGKRRMQHRRRQISLRRSGGKRKKSNRAKNKAKKIISVKITSA